MTIVMTQPRNLDAEHIQISNPQSRLLLSDPGENLLAQMSHSQGMFKSRMICIDVRVFRRAQLFELSKALQLWRVEYFDGEGAEANGFMDGVVGVQTSWFFEGAEVELRRHRVVVVCVGRCSAVDHRIRKSHFTAQDATSLLRLIMLELWEYDCCPFESSFWPLLAGVNNGDVWWSSRRDSRET